MARFRIEYDIEMEEVVKVITFRNKEYKDFEPKNSVLTKICISTLAQRMHNDFPKLPNNFKTIINNILTPEPMYDSDNVILKNLKILDEYEKHTKQEKIIVDLGLYKCRFYCPFHNIKSDFIRENMSFEECIEYIVKYCLVEADYGITENMEIILEVYWDGPEEYEEKSFNYDRFNGVLKISKKNIIKTSPKGKMVLLDGTFSNKYMIKLKELIEEAKNDEVEIQTYEKRIPKDDKEIIIERGIVIMIENEINYIPTWKLGE